MVHVFVLCQQSIKHVITVVCYRLAMQFSTWLMILTACLQTAIGHWGEVLFPLFSILRAEANFANPPDQFVLLHLKRAHLIEWSRAVMATALQVGTGQALPPIILQEETANFMQQTCEHCSRQYWGQYAASSAVAIPDGVYIVGSWLRMRAAAKGHGLLDL